VGISATGPCVPEDFLACYYGYISRRQTSVYGKQNDGPKNSSGKQGKVAEIPT